MAGGGGGGNGGGGNGGGGNGGGGRRQQHDDYNYSGDHDNYSGDDYNYSGPAVSGGSALMTTPPAVVIGITTVRRVPIVMTVPMMFTTRTSGMVM